MKVLLVDDDPDVRRIGLLSLAKVGGFDVATAESGEQAISLANESVFDAIVLDVMMPLMDGPATLERLRQGTRNSSTPVVFMTAKVQPDEVQRYLNLGVKGVILKPFDPMTLPDHLLELISPR